MKSYISLFIITIIVCLSAGNLQGQQLVSEEFDSELDSASIGSLVLNNYQQDVAAWSFSRDETGLLSGENSLQISVENSGSEFWALQVRAEALQVTQGEVYVVNFKGLSSTDLEFEFRSEGAINHVETVSLTADEATDLQFELPAAESTGEVIMFFALGNTGNDYDLWLDAVSVSLDRVEEEEPPVNDLLVSEEFDSELDSASIGSLVLNNYEQDVAAWSFARDETGLLSGENSLQISVENSGSEFWALQVRAEALQVTQGEVYVVNFKGLSSTDLEFGFRSEGAINHIETVSLTADEATDLQFELPPAESTGEVIMFFALGNTGSGYELWLDAVSVSLDRVEEEEEPPVNDLLVSEEFDGELDGEQFGAFLLKNFQEEEADWSYSKDESGVISGDNSLHLDIGNSGTEWWALQVRSEGHNVKQGEVYEVFFKARSTKDMTFEFVAEGTVDYRAEVQMFREQVLDFHFVTDSMDNDGSANFLFALGNSAHGVELWVDSVIVRKYVPDTTSNDEEPVLSVSDPKAAIHYYMADNSLIIKGNQQNEPLRAYVFDLKGSLLLQREFRLTGQTVLPIGPTRQKVFVVMIADQDGRLLSKKKLMQVDFN